MRKLNHYQKDIIFILVLIGLQLVFTYFYPFRNPEVDTAVEVTRNFILVDFTFITTGETTTYIPILTGIYALLLIYLLVQKKRRFALIYGFAVVLVAKAYYLSELFALDGVYPDLTGNGFLSKQIVSNAEVLAQDVTLYLLGVLLFVKIAIYVHDYFMAKKTEESSL